MIYFYRKVNNFLLRSDNFNTGIDNYSVIMSLSHGSLVAIILLAFTTLFQGCISFSADSKTNEMECEETECSKYYLTLVKCVIYNGENVYNLSRTYFPPTEELPVFVTVNYNFEGGKHKRWYWTSQTSTLIHPLEGFQFFSLFFGDFSSRAKTVNLTLPDGCYDASEGYYQLLTQRLKAHASNPVINPKITDDYNANSANLTTLQDKIHSNKFLISILYLYQLVVPVCIAFTAGLIVFSMDEKIAKVLPSETDDQKAVTYSVVALAVLVFAFVIIMDIVGIVFATTKTKDLEYYRYIRGDSGRNALYVLPIFLLPYDILFAFYFAPQLIYMVWITHQQSKDDITERNDWQNSHTIAGAIVCIICVFSNHSFYIVVGLISDPIHAHSIGIYYIIIVVIYLLVFKLGWKTYLESGIQCRCFKQCAGKNKFEYDKVVGGAEKSLNATGTTGEREPLMSSNDRDDETTSSMSLKAVKISTISSEQNSEKGVISKKGIICNGKCNLRTVCVVLMIVFLIPFQLVVTVAFVYVPIKRTVEDVPAQINVIYKSLIVLFTALITYKLFVEPAVKMKKVKPDGKWVKIGDYTLKNKDKEDILKPGSWMDDTVINAAMHLMRRYIKFETRSQVQGLVKLSSLSQRDEECNGSLRQNCVQLIHTGGDHWITASTVGPKTQQEGHVRVYIYDSLLKHEKTRGSEAKHSIEDDDKNEQRIPADTVTLIAHLLGEEDPNKIEREYPNVQQQDNGSECGLFAIAFAFEICKGEGAALEQGRKFDTKKMRKHLVDCFEKGVMKSFPHTDT